MTTIAHDHGFDRRRYRGEVERLLDLIRRLVGEARELYATGLRGAELQQRKRELEAARRQLARLVSHEPR